MDSQHETASSKASISGDLLAPFLAVARGIPDNWPGDCILRYEQRNDGTLYLGYYGVEDAANGITINQWRALLGANVATQAPL